MIKKFFTSLIFVNTRMITHYFVQSVGYLPYPWILDKDEELDSHKHSSLLWCSVRGEGKKVFRALLLEGKMKCIFYFERFTFSSENIQFYFVSMLLVKLMQNKLECLRPGIHFQPCLTFVGKTRAYYCGVPHGACISKFTLSWPMTKALAYLMKKQLKYCWLY